MGQLSLRGRARRRDYLLVNIVLAIVPALIGATLEHQIESAFDRLPTVVGLIVLIPFVVGLVLLSWIVGLTLPVRRLHDMNLSGGYYFLMILINALPYVGTLLVFLWLAFVPGTKGRNRYGSDPRGPPDKELAEVFDGPAVAASPSLPSPPR